MTMSQTLSSRKGCSGPSLQALHCTYLALCPTTLVHRMIAGRHHASSNALYIQDDWWAVTALDEALSAPLIW